MKRKMSMDEFLSRYWPRVPDEVVEAAGGRVWKRLEAEMEKHDTSLWSLSVSRTVSLPKKTWLSLSLAAGTTRPSSSPRVGTQPPWMRALSS